MESGCGSCYNTGNQKTKNGFLVSKLKQNFSIKQRGHRKEGAAYGHTGS